MIRVDMTGADMILKAFNRAHRSTPRLLDVEVSSAAAEMYSMIRARIPVKSGELQKSLDLRVSPGALGPTAEISTGTNHGIYILYGTRPHIILPVNARGLYWPGADHPHLIVHHPGIKPQDFVGEAWDAAEKSRLWENHMNRLANNIIATFVA